MLDLLTMLAAANPADHVYNHVFLKSEDGWWIWSGNQGVLVLSAVLLVIGMIWAANKIQIGPESEGAERYVTKNKFAHMIEVICVYLREEVVRPLLHERTEKLMPFLWSLFFFILINNLLGLVPLLDLMHLINKDWTAAHATPIGGTATQNIWVTGAPWYVAWMIFILEFAGQVLIKPVALALRLFANMTAGHILLATLFMFVGAVWFKSIAIKAPVTVISVLGGIAVNFLEIFVAFLQAFIFMFLTTVFISLMDHHDEHGHEHEHDHAHGHEHAAA